MDANFIRVVVNWHAKNRTSLLTRKHIDDHSFKLILIPIKPDAVAAFLLRDEWIEISIFMAMLKIIYLLNICTLRIT